MLNLHLASPNAREKEQAARDLREIYLILDEIDRYVSGAKTDT